MGVRLFCCLLLSFLPSICEPSNTLYYQHHFPRGGGAVKVTKIRVLNELRTVSVITGFLQVSEGVLYVLLILHLLFEFKSLPRMCIIVMCADHNGLCTSPVFQWNSLHLDLLCWFPLCLVQVLKSFLGLDPCWGDKCITPPSRAQSVCGM